MTYTVPVGSSVPMRKRAPWFRLCVSVEDRLMQRDPVRGLRLADAAGEIVRRLGLYGKSAQSIRAVLPWLTEEDSRRVAGISVRHDFRNRALNRLVIAGRFDLVAPLVNVEKMASVGECHAAGRAVVLGVMHMGPIAATSVSLHKLGLPAFLVRTGAGQPPPPGLEVGSLDGPHLPAMILRRALERLKMGRFVVMGLDRRSGQETGPVSCLGRAIRLRRGAFTLARMAGVPLIPVMTRWTRSGFGIEVEAGPALSIRDRSGEGSQVEDRLAADLAQWLDGYVRCRPEAVSLQLLHLLEAAPLVAAEADVERALAGA